MGLSILIIIVSTKSGSHGLKKRSPWWKILGTWSAFHGGFLASVAIVVFSFGTSGCIFQMELYQFISCYIAPCDPCVLIKRLQIGFTHPFTITPAGSCCWSFWQEMNCRGLRWDICWMGWKRSANLVYPLVNCYMTMENHHFQWENPL